MSRLKHFFKRATLVTALAGSLFGGYAPERVEAAQKARDEVGFTIQGEDIKRAKKVKELQRIYSLEEIIHDKDHRTNIYYHSPKNLEIIKGVFRKLPSASQKYVKRVFICSPEDYLLVATTGEMESAGFAYDDSLFINDHERFGQEGLEHIVLHEGSHVHENLVDPISGKDESNGLYKKYFKLKAEKESKELAAAFMMFPDIRAKYIKEAEEIEAQINALDFLPPSHYLEGDWDKETKGSSPPEIVAVRKRGYSWKDEYEGINAASDATRTTSGAIDKKQADFKARYSKFKVEYDRCMERIANGEDVPNEVRDDINNRLGRFRDENDQLKEEIGVFNASIEVIRARQKKAKEPRAGYASPYATTSAKEDRAETAAVVLSQPKLVRQILTSSNDKGTQLLRRKIDLLYKYGYIDTNSYKYVTSPGE